MIKEIHAELAFFHSALILRTLFWLHFRNGRLLCVFTLLCNKQLWSRVIGLFNSFIWYLVLSKDGVLLQIFKKDEVHRVELSTLQGHP